MDSNLTIIWLCNSMCTDFRRCGEIDEEMKQKLNEMHVGRLIHILSHTMKRHNPAEVMENDDLTTMQKHVLKFILLETMHRDLYQKDIEEEFQIRKPTVTGILKLMEKNGYIYRESAKQDARLKQIIPTEKAEKIRPAILKSIEEGEAKMLRGIRNIEIAGKHCVVIGRSNIVGKPMALLMLRENATVTICHSRTENLKEICKEADILIVAIGKPRYIGADYIKEGAVVIDVGIHRNEENKLCGDVRFEEAEQIASYITPVPGGVGPMTIAMLMHNCVDAMKLYS